MKIMYKKVIKGFLWVLLIVIVVLAGVIVMKKEIDNLYYTLKYKEEVTYINKFLHIILTEDEETVKDIFTPGAPWLTEGGIDVLKRGLREIDVSEFKVRLAAEGIEDNKEVLAIRIYFQDNEFLYIDLKLKKDAKWLIQSLMLSDKIIKMMEKKGIF